MTDGERKAVPTYEAARRQETLDRMAEARREADRFLAELDEALEDPPSSEEKPRHGKVGT